MREKAFDTLVLLLRLGMADSCPEPKQAIGLLTPDEWREMYRMAQRHAVTGIAWDGIERLEQSHPEQIQTMPADLTGKWFADSQAIQAANRRMTKLAAEVQTSLQTAGFESQILKGAALAAYYPEPTHRQAADVDVWVMQKQGTCSLLTDHRQALLAYLRQQPNTAIGEVVYHHVETTIGNTEVEYHITPTWLCNPIHNSRLQRLFAARPLNAEMQEVYALLHAFRHIYHDGMALRHVMDYYLVCRANREAGVSVPDTIYSQLRLTRFAGTMNEVAEHLFGQADDRQLSNAAQHLLAAIPERKVSKRVQWDYPAETMCALPWRSIHYLWRKANHYV